MAQRFYFDVTIGSFTIRDDEGVEANDIVQATEEAQVVLEEMRASGETSASEGGWHMTIRGETEAALKTLPLTLPPYPAPPSSRWNGVLN